MLLTSKQNEKKVNYNQNKKSSWLLFTFFLCTYKKQKKNIVLIKDCSAIKKRIKKLILFSCFSVEKILEMLF